MFFNTQTCPDLNTSQQYRSIVFYQSEEEKYTALRIKKEIEEKNNKVYDTDILPYKNFYLAEEYHQKYYFKRAKYLFEEMLETYPNLNDIRISTAVGHINGYIHGNGSSELLSREYGKLGLSKEGQEMLMKYVKGLEKRRLSEK
jgi:peptide-methionine (S)-S-oxide reductase